MTVKWNYEEMTTGLSEIDEQHKEWFHRFNMFQEAIVNGQGQAALRSALSFLADYAEVHFAREEAYMQRYHCATQAKNLEQHAEFRAKLAEIQNWVDQGGSTMVEVMALHLTLEEWMIKHICDVDVHLRAVVEVP